MQLEPQKSHQIFLGFQNSLRDIFWTSVYSHCTNEVLQTNFSKNAKNTHFQSRKEPYFHMNYV